MVDLLRGLVVPRAPRRAAVERDDGALIDAHHHALAIRGVDPELLRVVAARCTLESRKRRAAVSGLVARRAEGVHDVGILGIDLHARVVAALSVTNALIVRRHLPPRGASVVRAPKARVGGNEHALRIRASCHGDGHATIQPGQATAGKLPPGDTAVDRLEDQGRGASCVRRLRRRRYPWRRRAMLHRRREYHGPRVLRPRELPDTRRVVPEHRARPWY